MNEVKNSLRSVAETAAKGDQEILTRMEEILDERDNGIAADMDRARREVLNLARGLEYILSLPPWVRWWRAFRGRLWTPPLPDPREWMSLIAEDLDERVREATKPEPEAVERVIDNALDRTERGKSFTSDPEVQAYREDRAEEQMSG
jgi:hypothetical protein